MNRSRHAKTSANKLIKNSQKRDRSAVARDQVTPRAVVKIDPFVTKKTINHCYGSTTLDEEVEVERDEQNFICRWRIGTRRVCGISMDAPDDLIQHLLDVHSENSSNKYTCNWKRCQQSYKTKDDFEEHLKYHTIIDPQDGDDDKMSDDYESGSDVKEEDLEVEDSSDSDYRDSSDEEFRISKKKRKKRQSTPPIQVKKVRSESLEVYNRNSNVVGPAPQRVCPAPTPVQLSFYRFTCMWVVPFVMKNKTPAPVVCQRKFTVLEESMEHLEGHHIAKIKNSKQTPKCYWKECPANDREFESIDDLIAHVRVHTEERLMSYNSNGTLISSGGTGLQSTSRPSVQVKTTPPPPKQNTVAHEKQAVKKSPASTAALSKPVARNQPVDIQEAEVEYADSPPPAHENITWMTSVLHTLMCAKFKRSDSALCPLSESSCHFCRFASMRNREFCKDTGLANDAYEFTLFKAKYWDAQEHGDPFSFVTALYEAIAKDEAANHNSKSFRETFWIKCLETDGPMCSSHPLNHNLINLFPVQYKSCSHCAKEAESWPTELQENLIIKLRETESGASTVRYPDVLSVKGRVYQLSAVVSVDSSNSSAGKENKYFAYVKVKNTWISKSDRPINMTLATQAFNIKAACIVIYTAKVSVLDKENVWADQDLFKRWYLYEDCNKLSISDVTPCISKYGISSSVAEKQSKEKLPSGKMSPLPKRLSSDDDDRLTLPTLELKRNRLASAFIHRRMENRGNESCIISVLQALLQTTITTKPPKLCDRTNSCDFCNMLSFIRRILKDQKGDPIPAYEFTHFKDLGITTEEGDPGVYVSNLVYKIVNSDRSNHDSTVAKYKFMIRLQKKSCNCMLSCERYHWPVSPVKKNESLMDLMMKYSTDCTQCKVMTNVQPIQMPDNLIITIEQNKKNPEASVHFPDEWASYNIRYFLGAIVVSDPAAGESRHYFTYCRVLGKWMRYDDDKVEGASSSDVLGNKRACVLIYVAEQLSEYALQSVYADGSAYRFPFMRGPVKEVKEEPKD